MIITIHRGTSQIGGCITEIKTDSTRIVIDMGEELDNGLNWSNSEITIDGLTSGKINFDGVFFTHYHGDHIGAFYRILEGIPLYIGEASKEIYLTLLTHTHSSSLEAAKKLITFKPNVKIEVGDISITPYFVDHSAYDAYMFLIESEGKRILHTGDFRNHGFRGKGLDIILDKYISTVDLVITEGTTLSREKSTPKTEQELMLREKQLIESKKYVFLLCSSTNIDRIAGFYASSKNKKYFLCDKYQKEVLETVSKYSSKYSSLYGFERVLTYGSNLLEKLKTNGFCMLVRNNDYFYEIMSKFDKNESLVIYSMWNGYLSDKSKGFDKFLFGFDTHYLHTSGHASIETIERLISKTNPKNGVIVIHTDSSKNSDYLNVANKIIELQDGEEYSL